MASPIGQFSDSSPAVLKMTGVGSISGGEAMSRLEGSYSALQGNPIKSRGIQGPSPSPLFQSRPLNTSHMSDVLNEKASQRVGLLVDGQK